MLGPFRRHMKAALRTLPASKSSRPPLVAYVGAASGDNPGFQRMIGDEIVRVGGRVKAVKLASPRAKLSTAQGVLEDCDVVFVSGGDVEAGMNVLRERGVLPIFRALGRAGRPMIGLSAGSIMLSRAWVRFPEHDDEGGALRSRTKKSVTPALFRCMGLAPVYVDAHAEEDRWAELRVLLGLVAASGEARAVGYGLTCKGGIRLEPAEAGVKVVAFGTPAPRFVVRGGRVLASRPLVQAPGTRGV